MFNQLTGLNQKIGNFPGITVDKRSGVCQLDTNTQAEILDLPGIYSLYPRSLDEKIVAEIFANNRHPDFPDKVVLIADATNLKSCLLLLTQLIDIQIPAVLALNMVDLAAKSGLSIDINKLSESLDLPIVLINARQGKGIDELKKVLVQPLRPSSKKIFFVAPEIKQALDHIRVEFKLTTDYAAYQYLQQTDTLNFLTKSQKELIHQVAKQYGIFPGKYQGAETINRYGFIQDILNTVILRLPDPEWKRASHRLDSIFTTNLADT